MAHAVRVRGAAAGKGARQGRARGREDDADSWARASGGGRGTPGTPRRVRVDDEADRPPVEEVPAGASVAKRVAVVVEVRRGRRHVEDTFAPHVAQRAAPEARLVPRRAVQKHTVGDVDGFITQPARVERDRERRAHRRRGGRRPAAGGAVGGPRRGVVVRFPSARRRRHHHVHVGQ